MTSFVPLKVVGSCVMPDDELFGHMENAILRGLPEVLKQEPQREGVIALVGSAPSLKTQLDVIKKMQESGTRIVAIKDAHDYLIANGIMPDYALAIDPQPHRWSCFKLRNKTVQYMIASQCHGNMFDYLQDCDVTIWHPYVTKGQKRPAKRMTVGGGTTSGLRAISLFYVLGWRHFALFGFDSCLENGDLRVIGDKPKESDVISEVRIEKGGESFYCNPSMALQAEHFQEYYNWLPDAHFYGYGKGLIQAIIAKRESNYAELEKVYVEKPANSRASFIHFGGITEASYRYRCLMPSKEVGASINDYTADTLIFTKPQPEELMEMARCKARGGTVIVDFCDDHFDWMHYAEALRLADKVTCPTKELANRISELGKSAIVIPDPFEYPLAYPHCNGVSLLWYGHGVNRKSLDRIRPELEEYSLRVVSSFEGSIPWSKETMLREFAEADIVIMPFTKKYKSNNRTLEAIMQGCFVVAEPHPSLEDIPGIWIGNIKEGIEWTRLNPALARQRTLEAQKFVMDAYSQRTVGYAWKNLIQLPTISGAEKRNGTDG